ncbi:MAG: MgtC/SapB family protein [Hyphomonas sp.]|uniref:MgtC/SapB family protein n=1 Tax=Hyphomonas sp. TaxID=87 RepID=UPI0034A078D6
MLQEIRSTIIAEFSDIPDVATVTKITIRISVAALLGGILGYERERKARGAGVRTHMLVAVGAAIFVIGPTQAGMSVGDLSRIIQGIIQGIGFLGAGAIILGTATRQVQGLTTAASVWAAAGIGISAGLGLEATAVLATVVVLFVLAIVPVFVRRAPLTSLDASENAVPVAEGASIKAGSQIK